MIVRINGVEIAMKTQAMAVHEVDPTVRPAILQTIDRALTTLDKPMWRLIVTAVAWLTMPTMAFAATSGTGGWALIHLLQQGAFWVGMAVSIWGVYEWQVGGPGWKERIIKGVGGYLLILVLPLIFTVLRASGIGM